MMRIARYCTSVLISGRTIPADVRLLIPLCGFLRIVDLKAKAPKRPMDPILSERAIRLRSERRGAVPRFLQGSPRRWMVTEAIEKPISTILLHLFQ